MIFAAAVGTSVASTNAPRPVEKVKKEHVSEQKSVAAFKQAIAFHQHNVDVLFNQFQMASEHVRGSRGNHAELERDRAFFIKVYQDDINQGVRVESGKRAIAEIEAQYAKKHEERDAYEAAKIAKLREQLQTALMREQRQFKKAKRKYAGFVNDETRPLLQQAEQYFANAIARASRGEVAQMTMALR